MSTLSDENVCFVKTDTDGYDFKILLSAIDWLAEQRPAILLESQVRDKNDLKASCLLLKKLHKIGYKYFIIWDDTGSHLLSTSDYCVVEDVNRHLLETVQSGVSRIISNFDVACFHDRDGDIYEKVSQMYRNGDILK